MSNNPTREEVELRAYEIFVANGCQHGHNEEDWLEAERQLSQLEDQASSSIAELQHRAAAAGRSSR